MILLIVYFFYSFFFKVMVLNFAPLPQNTNTHNSNNNKTKQTNKQTDKTALPNRLTIHIVMKWPIFCIPHWAWRCFQIKKTTNTQTKTRFSASSFLSTFYLPRKKENMQVCVVSIFPVFCAKTMWYSLTLIITLNHTRRLSCEFMVLMFYTKLWGWSLD